MLSAASWLIGIHFGRLHLKGPAGQQREERFRPGDMLRNLVPGTIAHIIYLKTGLLVGFVS
jgi:hypothetical protein